MLVTATLDRPFQAQGKYCYVVTLPEPVHMIAKAGGVVLLFEDDKPLGPGGSLHVYIRDRGQGQFSVWNNTLYFSSSDGSDCNTNGKKYHLTAFSLSKDDPVSNEIVRQISMDTETLLTAIHENYSLNNGFFLNFFGYFAGLRNSFRQNKLQFPGSVLEIGCGTQPYVALRFLLEGTQRYFATDIGPVENKFDRRLLEKIDFLSRIAAGTPRELTALLTEDGGLTGLTTLGGMPFEDIELDERFEFIWSVSVLEHVMEPERVVAKMVQLLKPGGHIWHSIDLRDHRDFDRPLDFLTLSEAEYASIKTENRMRASEWLTLFAKNGLELVDKEFTTFRRAADAAYIYTMQLEDNDWVDEVMRKTFSPLFREKSLADLSALGMVVLYRKPIG